MSETEKSLPKKTADEEFAEFPNFIKIYDINENGTVFMKHPFLGIFISSDIVAFEGNYPEIDYTLIKKLFIIASGFKEKN